MPGGCLEDVWWVAIGLCEVQMVFLGCIDVFEEQEGSSQVWPILHYIPPKLCEVKLLVGKCKAMVMSNPTTIELLQ